MARLTRGACIALFIGLLAARTYAADSPAAPDVQNAELRSEVHAIRQQMNQMQTQIHELEQRLEAVTAHPASPETAASSSPPPGVTPAPAASALGAPPPGVTVGNALKQLLPGPVSGPQAPSVGTATGTTPAPEGVIVPSIQGVPKLFIPDIGAVGDFTLTQSDLHHGDPRYNPSQDKFQLRDTQVIFFSAIDPYTNAQISIDKPNNGPFDVEEAFLVFNKLPWNMTLRAGQYRPVFGLLNETDTFQLPMVNRPQALARYIGPDGFVEPGVNLSAYIPNPWEADLKLDANMLSGINTTAFNHLNGQNFDFAYLGTLTYSRDLFSAGSMSAGASMAGGPGPGGQAYYEDPFLQLQYAPDQRHIWTWDLEGLLAERQGVGDSGVKRGFYSLLDYNFWLRWHAGFLLDVADRPGVPRGTEVGVSPILTYFVSDNTRLRLQYTHTTPSGPERPLDQVFVQATFSLGNLKPLH